MNLNIKLLFCLNVFYYSQRYVECLSWENEGAHQHADVIFWFTMRTLMHDTIFFDFFDTRSHQ